MNHYMLFLASQLKHNNYEVQVSGLGNCACFWELHSIPHFYLLKKLDVIYAFKPLTFAYEEWKKALFYTKAQPLKYYLLTALIWKQMMSLGTTNHIFRKSCPSETVISSGCICDVRIISMSKLKYKSPTQELCYVSYKCAHCWYSVIIIMIIIM